MKGIITWDNVIDIIQNLMVLVLIAVVTVCILTLIGFDVVVGTGSMMYLTHNNLRASAGISVATTGLLMSLMFIGYTMASGDRGKFIKTTGSAILLAAGVIYLVDIYFDALTADYLRFGQFVALTTLEPHVRNVQILFRSLLGGLSTVGEGLGIAIILGMPVLKSIIREALKTGGGKQENKVSKPSNTQPNSRPQSPHYKPKHRPDFSKLVDKIYENEDEAVG